MPSDRAQRSRHIGGVGQQLDVPDVLVAHHAAADESVAGGHRFACLSISGAKRIARDSSVSNQVAGKFDRCDMRWSKAMRLDVGGGQSCGGRGKREGIGTPIRARGRGAMRSAATGDQQTLARVWYR